jgi:hypothetical protein
MQGFPFSGIMIWLMLVWRDVGYDLIAVNGDARNNNAVQTYFRWTVHSDWPSLFTVVADVVNIHWNPCSSWYMKGGS